MNINRKSMTVGLVGLGLVGALTAGGVVAAQAATGGGSTPQPESTTSSSIGSHQFGHMAGMAFGQNSPMTAVASYLGLSRTELQDRLQSGKSLADVARTQGKSVAGLKDAMVAALKTNLDANGKLTADQKTAALAQMESRIDTMMNTTHGEGMGMGTGTGTGAGAGMGAGMGAGTGAGMGAGTGAGMGADMGAGMGSGTGPGAS